MKKTGFTLIELMVTVSIIALISTVSLASYFNSEKKSNLDGGMRALSANLNLTRNNFLSGTRYAGAVPAGGWGIHIDTATTTYILFADVNDNGLYDDGEAASSTGGQEFVLGASLSFSSSTFTNTLDVAFWQTDKPSASIMADSVSTSTACVEIKEDSSALVAGLAINSFGFFEIVDNCQ